MLRFCAAASYVASPAGINHSSHEGGKSAVSAPSREHLGPTASCNKPQACLSSRPFQSLFLESLTFVVIAEGFRVLAAFLPTTYVLYVVGVCGCGSRYVPSGCWVSRGRQSHGEEAVPVVCIAGVRMD